MNCASPEIVLTSVVKCQTSNLWWSRAADLIKWCSWTSDDRVLTHRVCKSSLLVRTWRYLTGIWIQCSGGQRQKSCLKMSTCCARPQGVRGAGNRQISSRVLTNPTAWPSLQNSPWSAAPSIYPSLFATCSRASVTSGFAWYHRSIRKWSRADVRLNVTLRLEIEPRQLIRTWDRWRAWWNEYCKIMDGCRPLHFLTP